MKYIEALGHKPISYWLELEKRMIQVCPNCGHGLNSWRMCIVCPYVEDEEE